MKRLTILFLLVASPALAVPNRTTTKAKKPATTTAPPAPPPAAPPSPPPAPAIKPLAETLAPDAKADYDAGKLLFGDGDMNGALVKFQSAYDKSKDPRLLWNMAACLKNLRKYARVLRLLDQYIAEGTTVTTEQDRADAVELRKNIESFTVNLTLKVNVPGAQIFVDDEPMGISPLEKAVIVDIGQRTLRLTKSGYKEVRRVESVGGSRDLTVNLVMEEEVHQGHLVVSAGDKDSIHLDGRVVAVGRYRGTLPSGGHMLRVTAKGMRSFQTEVMIQDERTRTIDVTLEPIPATGGGVPGWLWVTGGLALAAGASVGGYFLLKPEDKVGSPIRGTMDPGTVQLSFGR